MVKEHTPLSKKTNCDGFMVKINSDVEMLFITSLSNKLLSY